MFFGGSRCFLCEYADGDNYMSLVTKTNKDIFDEKLKKSSGKGALKRIVNFRNDAAHGRTITKSINDIEECFLSEVKVIKVLDNMLKNKVNY